MIDVAYLNRILRRPADVADQCRDDRDVVSLARTAILALVVAGAAFGAAVGAWHGGWQIAFAAFKLPIGILGTLTLAAPVFYALTAVFNRPWPIRPVISLMLSAGARFALVLLATTPMVWLTINFGASYEAVKLVATLAYASAGFSGLAVLVRGLGDGPRKKTMIALFAAVFVLIGAQNAWILRPYLVRSGATEVTLFTHEREGGLVVHLWRSVAAMMRGRGEMP